MCLHEISSGAYGKMMCYKELEKKREESGRRLKDCLHLMFI